MSGGHWNYVQYKIGDELRNIGGSGDVILRFPKLAQIYRDFGSLLESNIKELDWDLSGDTIIKDDLEFEKKFIEDLGKIINMKVKTFVYETEVE